jgi:hypothetical protein
VTWPAIQAFDARHQRVVSPAEIRPGDWMRDLGTLRRVEFVDDLGVAAGSGLVHIIHFVEQPGVANKVLGISSVAPAVVVWREAAP